VRLVKGVYTVKRTSLGLGAIVTGVAAFVAILVIHSSAGATSATQVVPDHVDPQAVAMAPATEPARMSATAALAAAETTSWGHLLAQGHNLEYRYGLFDPHTGIKTTNGVVWDGAKNVWAITAGGYSFPSAGIIANVQQPTGYAHFLTLFVDAATGKVLLVRQSN